ncbi:futalosine hydrolase [Methanosarcinales archaeon]|nr:MAG: futalosine hydrolase [Methanosarcinales archaeon]
MYEITVLLCSVKAETEHIQDKIKNPDSMIIGRRQAVVGELAGSKIMLVVSGVGKTNVSHTLTAIMEQINPERVILFGCAGAYPGTGLTTGDLTVAAKEIYGDEGILTPDGFCDLQQTNLPTIDTPGKTCYNEFLLDAELSKRVEEVLKNNGYAPCIGTFVTVSCCSGTQKRGELLHHLFGGICENMEGAAAAHVCTIYDVPLVEIRGISNLVVDRPEQVWNLPLAASRCQQAVLTLLEEI